MKIVAFSDIHGSVPFPKIPDGTDLVLVAGDVAPLSASLDLEGHRYFRIKEQIDWVFHELPKWVNEYPSTDFVVVPGNHDFWGATLDGNPNWPANLYVRDNGLVSVRGKNIFCSSWVLPINGRWIYEMANEAEATVALRIPKHPQVDIVVTHNPPLVEGSDIDRCSNGDHCGSKFLTREIEKVQPELLVCGHIHSGSHECTKIGKTRCFNVSLLDDFYGPKWSPKEIEID